LRSAPWSRPGSGSRAASAARTSDSVTLTGFNRVSQAGLKWLSRPPSSIITPATTAAQVQIRVARDRAAQNTFAVVIVSGDIRSW